MILPRRKFLTGLGSLLAAPAIVRVQSIMPIKVFDDAAQLTFEELVNPRWSHIALIDVDGLIVQFIDGTLINPPGLISHVDWTIT